MNHQPTPQQDAVTPNLDPELADLMRRDTYGLLEAATDLITEARARCQRAAEPRATAYLGAALAHVGVAKTQL